LKDVENDGGISIDQIEHCRTLAFCGCAGPLKTPNYRKGSSSRLKPTEMFGNEAMPSPDVLEPPAGLSFGELLD
jgi:hypothetical protein